MALTLALCTCGPQIEVALEGDSLRAVSTVRLAGRSARATLVLAAVDLLMEDAGLPPEELKRVLVTRGPGSFTGIRSGLATALGLAAARAMEVAAFGSLDALAARVIGPETVWAAQPGRRGEVYARPFAVTPGEPPRAVGELRVLRVDEAVGLGPWVAAEALDLGAARRVASACGCAEGLLRLARLGARPEPCEPLYVEAPPIHLQG